MRTAMVALFAFGLLAPAFAQEDEDLGGMMSSQEQEVTLISILGGCGGYGCYVGRDVPEACVRNNCLKCTPTDATGVKGKCTSE